MFKNLFNKNIKANIAGIDIDEIKKAKKLSEKLSEESSLSYEGILKEGLLYLKKAIAGDKLDPDFTQKAILSFIKAQEKKKMKPEPYFYLSYIALLCHDKDLSLKYLNVVKEIKPDLPGIKNLESRLMN